MKKMKEITALILALVMVFSLAACGSKPASNNPGTPDNTKAPSNTNAPDDGAPAATGAYKIGGIGPLTGGAAIYGNAAKNGAQIAVDEINAMGGIQFELMYEDDAHDPETSVNAYNKLVDDGLQILTGTVTSAPCLSVAPLAAQDRIFVLTPSASNDDVPAAGDNVFQLCFADTNQGTGSADYIASNMADAKIAIIYQNDDPYSQGIRDTFVAEADVKGLSVVYQGTFTADTNTDFSVQLADAQSAGADLVFLPLYYEANSVIITQANQMGYNPTYFGVDGMDGILTQPGFDVSLAEGVMLLTPFSADATDDMTVNFVSKYNQLFGETPNQFAADGYDCIYAVYYALQKTNCTPDMSAAEICEALIAVFTGGFTYSGLTGANMTWDASGAVSKAPAAVVIKDGVYVGA